MSVFDVNLGGGPATPTSNIEALIAKMGITQPLLQQNQLQQRTVINELDEIFSELSAEQRRGVESNEEYNIALGGVLQKYLLYSLSHTPEGIAFISGPGKKLGQALLDTTRRVVTDIDKEKKNELEQMNNRMTQLEEIITRQNRVMKEQEDKLQQQSKQLTEFKASLGGE